MGYVVLMEGRNREVRRLWESQGMTVSRLKRVRFGEVFMPSKLKKGEWLELPQKDTDVLYGMAGMPTKTTQTLSPREQSKLERLAKKSGKKTVKRLASGEPNFRRKRPNH